MGLRLEHDPSRPADAEAIPIVLNTLRAEDPPAPQSAGEPTHTFRAAKRRYVPEQETRALGLAGELLANSSFSHANGGC
jgi:hypothetical protein